MEQICHRGSCFFPKALKFKRYRDLYSTAQGKATRVRCAKIAEGKEMRRKATSKSGERLRERPLRMSTCGQPRVLEEASYRGRRWGGDFESRASPSAFQRKTRLPYPVPLEEKGGV